MLNASRQTILDRLPEEAAVLDVGGWAKPFARADWVIDLLPYETRGLYGYDQGSAGEERFSAASWVQRDFCDREPWPFADDQFDFAICSHTLEDVRDPVWVCQEMSRVARAGYVETPSRLAEQTYGIQGQWVGWGHHHWLVDVTGAGLEFVFKTHVLHGRPEMQVPLRAYEALPEDRRVHALFWEGELPAQERVFIGIGEIDDYLASVTGAEAVDQRFLRRRKGASKKR